MREQLLEIQGRAVGSINAADGLKALEELRVSLLGKKGELTAILKGMGALSAEERPVIGQLANEARGVIEGLLAAKQAALEGAEAAARIAAEAIDVTMPGRALPVGHKHPMTYVIDDVKRIFIGMGYTIAEGPDVETAYYNFEALNIPEEHPARDEQDTFYVKGGHLLRTQTSPVQIRYMQGLVKGGGKPPIRIIAPGKVFRSDAVDATHSPVFHQVEGLVVDKNVTMGDLKGALTAAMRELLGDVKARFRPHHFPFTEPSAEMDVSCFACGGEGCRVCKGEGWIEMLGCGMVHPRVLENCGLGTGEYSGFAFGMGLERIAMQRYGISDMRLLFENDWQFLAQFVR